MRSSVFQISIFSLCGSCTLEECASRASLGDNEMRGVGFEEFVHFHDSYMVPDVGSDLDRFLVGCREAGRYISKILLLGEFPTANESRQRVSVVKMEVSLYIYVNCVPHVA